MAGHLVAPRPVRLGTGCSIHLPFFLSNALPGPRASASPQAPHDASIVTSASSSQAAGMEIITPQIPNPTTLNHDEMSIEDLAANIRLDDDDEPLSPAPAGPGSVGPEPVAAAAAVVPLVSDYKPASTSATRWTTEEPAIGIAPPRYASRPIPPHRGFSVALFSPPQDIFHPSPPCLIIIL